MHSVPLNKGRESSSTTRKESIDRVSLERPSCFFPLILLWMRPHFVSTLTLKWKFWSRPTLEKKLVKTMQWKNGGGQASVRSLPSFPWFFFEWGLILCRLLLWSENSYTHQLLEKKNSSKQCSEKMATAKPVWWVSGLLTRFEEQLPCRIGPQTHHSRINVQQNKESLIHISQWKFSLVISGLTRTLTKINGKLCSESYYFLSNVANLELSCRPESCL